MNKKILTTITLFLGSLIANAQVQKIDLEQLKLLTNQEEAKSTDNGTGTCIVGTEKTLNTLKKYEQIKVLLNQNSAQENELLKKVLLEELMNEHSQNR